MTTEFYGLEPGGLLPASALDQLDTARMGLIAAGRPDVPATTPYTAAELNALAVGTEYRSTDGPQGAWRWRKTGASTWTVTDGDTGWRDVKSLISGSWTFPSGLHILQFRRTAPDVIEFKFRGDSVDAQPVIIAPAPTGFIAGDYSSLGSAARVTSPSAAHVVAAHATSSELRMYPIPTAGGTYVARGRYASAQPWPTTLPGSAA